MTPKKPHAGKTKEKKQRKAGNTREKDLTKLNALLKVKDDEIMKLISSQEELISLLKRVQAGFENYKKRAENEQATRATYANSELVRKLLPLLDSFDMGKQPESAKGLLDGFRLIHAQLLDVLRQEGLEPIQALGERFDPLLHEILLKKHSDKPKNIILEELQKGYSFKERVLRPSRVKVSNGPQSAKETKDEE